MNQTCPSCNEKLEMELVRCTCGFEIQPAHDPSTELKKEEYDLVIFSPKSPDEIINVLIEKVENELEFKHQFIWSWISSWWFLAAKPFKKMDLEISQCPPVSGTINKTSFELKNPEEPIWSSSVWGKVEEYEKGSRLYLKFHKIIPFFNFGRILSYGINRERDIEIILRFLNFHLATEKIT